MKKHSFTTWVVGTLVVFATAAAHAQQSDESANSGPAEASSAQSAKQIRKANRLLAKRVRSALVRIKGLDSSNIVPIVKGSVVTLGGSVPDATQIPLATTAARGVQGVSDVRDSLTVKAPGQ